jgi:hypothetical protein
MSLFLGIAFAAAAHNASDIMMSPRVAASSCVGCGVFTETLEDFLNICVLFR